MKAGTLITLLKEEISDRNILHKEIADSLSYTPTYISRMLRGEKMSTELYEEIMDASGITLSDLSRRHTNESVQAEDLVSRIGTWEGFLLQLKQENLPARVALLESEIKALKRKLGN